MNNGQIRITAQLDDSTLPNPVPMSICDSPTAILLVITLNQCRSIPKLDEDKEKALVHRPSPRASCLVQQGREALWKVPCVTPFIPGLLFLSMNWARVPTRGIPVSFGLYKLLIMY